jgi:hypothetical protein
MSRPRLVRLSFLGATQIFMLYFSRFGSNCCRNRARPKKRWDIAKLPNAAPTSPRAGPDRITKGQIEASRSRLVSHVMSLSLALRTHRRIHLPLIEYLVIHQSFSLRLLPSLCPPPIQGQRSLRAPGIPARGHFQPSRQQSVHFPTRFRTLTREDREFFSVFIGDIDDGLRG